MFEENPKLLNYLLEGLKLVTHRNVMMIILEAIEHVCKHDVVLQLTEEKFKESIEACDNFKYLEAL